MITEDELNSAIKNFAKTIDNQKIILVHHKPDNESLPTNCIENVRQFIVKNGGYARYGWTFNYRTSPEYGDYLFATHHAIWLSPNENLIDITPFHAEEKHHPLTNQGSVLFLPDNKAQPIKRTKFLIPRPLKYFPIKKSKELNGYMAVLRAKEAKYYKDNFGITLRSKK